MTYTFAPAGRPLSAAVYPERSPQIAQPPRTIFDIFLQNVRIFVLIPNPLSIKGGPKRTVIRGPKRTVVHGRREKKTLERWYGVKKILKFQGFFYAKIHQPKFLK